MAFKDPDVKPVIEPIVSDISAVDEKYRDLYAETTDGKFQIKADIAFQSDFENMRKALAAERENSKANKAKVKELQSALDAYDGVDAVSVKGMRSELESLKSNETDISKLKSGKADLELKYKELSEKFENLVKQNERYESERKLNTLKEQARKALKQNGISEGAEDDGLMWAVNSLELTDDGSARVKEHNAGNFPAGISVDSWAQFLKKSKPYLFGGSIGGGAGGSSAGSPGIDSWTNTGIDGGINVTKLVQAAREDPQATLAVARKAGVEKEVLNRFGYLFKKQ